MKTCMLDDYGLWMFASPHEWPSLAEVNDLVAPTDIGFDASPFSSRSSSAGTLSRFPSEVLVQIFGWLPTVGNYLTLKLVSKRMHDLVINLRFTAMVYREMLQPDLNRGLYWVYPIEQKSGEYDSFVNSLKTWITSGSNVAGSKHLIFSHGFPVIQFVYALHAEDSPRNRRRLWNNVKRLKEIWVDYRLNGWKVNRFRVPYPNSASTSENRG